MRNSTAYMFPGLMTFDEIVCRAFDITMEQLKAPDKKREGADGRKFAMWYLKKNSNLTYAEIGKQYNERKRPATTTAAKRAGELMKTNKAFREKCEKAIALLGQLNITT